MHKKIAIYLGASVFLLDQLIKLTIAEKSINYGALFGLGASNGIMILLQCGLLVCIVYLIFQQSFKEYTNILFVVLGAGLSNTVDRFIWGGVVDYINLGVFLVNIADIAINLSVFAIIVMYLIKKWENSQSRTRTKNKD